MPKVDLANVAYCKIFPPIGIGRVGDSEETDGYFIAPEYPGGSIETPHGPVEHDAFRYRDRAGRIKRQAARFRIYAFDKKDRPIGEITDEHAEITWTATLANKKAAWFGFFGAAGARAAFRGEQTPKSAEGKELKIRNPEVGALRRVTGGPHGHRYQPDETRASALEIKCLSRTVRGRNRHHSNATDADPSLRLDFVGKFKHGKDVYLGELATDDYGRLIVLGGRGVSEPVDANGQPLATPEDKWIVHYANNNDWHDDVSDGPVTARVRLRKDKGEGRTLEVRGGAWVIVAPPDFAPDVTNLVTLYDVMEEVALEVPSLANATTAPTRNPDNPDLEHDIWPIIQRSAGYRWVNQAGLRGHGQGKPGDALDGLPETFEDFKNALTKGGEAHRDHFVRMVRPPTYASPTGRRPGAHALEEAAAFANSIYMPPLAGDEGDCATGEIDHWLTLTYAQYARLLKWQESEDLRLGGPTPLPDNFLADGSVNPSVLTRSVLERCAGGAFYPGIEATATTRDPKLYSEAFRIDHDTQDAGDITKYMALPWQADFYECRQWWWPAQRPDDVVLEDTFKEVFAEFQAEQTGDLKGTFERALMNRASWDRGVDAGPRPSDDFILNVLLPFSEEQQRTESAKSYIARIAEKWTTLLLAAANSEGSPWRSQFVIQEFLDKYSGRYYHLRAFEASSLLTVALVAVDFPEFAKRFQIKSIEDIQRVWREAARNNDASISTALGDISSQYDESVRKHLTDQIVAMLRAHPSIAETQDQPGSAKVLHDVLTGTETVDKLDQVHPEEVYFGEPLYYRYAVVELRDAMRDLAYVLNTGRNGDNGMVNEWRNRGFVVSRTSSMSDGQALTVQIETERSKYKDASPRDLFYFLLNIQDFPDFPAETIRIVEEGLNYAQAAIDSASIQDEDHPESFIPYDDTGFRAKLDEIYEIQRGRGRNYDIFYQLRSRNRDSILRGLLDLAPFNQCDGAWLRNISAAGPGDAVRSLLFEVWSDEIGNGDPSLHHGTLYTTLMESLGIKLPALTSRAYADREDIPTEAYVNPVFQLAISLNSDRFYPELIGMTLYLEWEVLSLIPGILLRDYLGIDSQFWRMHVGIDNATNGHGAKARDAVMLYLDRIRQEGGEAAVQAYWARIWRGFVAFSVVGPPISTDTAIARRRPPNVSARVGAIMARKKRYGSQNHLNGRIGPHRINDLFEDTDLFQAVLADSRWIVPGDPDKSAFIDYLTTFQGPMYKIFDPADLAIWRAWIEWLGHEGDTDSIKRYYDKGEAMEKLLHELRTVAEAVEAHARYRLSDPSGALAGKQRRVAEFFSSGDILGLMRALKDPDNGWVVPGSPSQSPLLADVARGGRPMGDALDKRYPTIGNRIGRQIVIEWVRAGCPIPGEPRPPREQTSKPLKPLGPKLFMNTHGFGAVH
ncbi:Iron-containing redox enzyme [Bradyrhizobium brasilense]|uniref:Iron-containing redox enzyme n=1 Tax=Bradyrhizobium brasilense TaxID=1419277 RepID=A0A1G6RXP5_9BRAD|nr:LodA/GoxA family CTQ-dependent oxidase [Bradyrhizobium brasilense]SDD09359.1 Iron-containing redox enzyme [Bradyrhizobium brasilense]